MTNDLFLYIHYPFCKSKCPYCDFNSHVKKEVADEDFASAYEKELDYFASQLKGRQLKTIFFGGGTPSLMPLNLVERILNKAASIWAFAPNIEISLEANPTSFESQKFRDFKYLGINRLSIGIQALNDADLKFLGREHSAFEAKETIKNAAKIFDNYSFDLIYARPKQALKSWESELAEAIKLAPHHLSLYQLTIEKGTAFYSMFKSKKFEMPDENLAADFYDLTNEITAKASLELYEISNYARANKECAHNLAYWKSQDYLGIGAGAHSRVYLDDDKNRSKIMNWHDPKKWQNEILKNAHAIQEIEKINQEELLEEVILMGLRLSSGIDNEIFLRHFGRKYQEIFDWEKLKNLEKLGLIELKENNISITKSGRILTNSIIEKIIT